MGIYYKDFQTVGQHRDHLLSLLVAIGFRASETGSVSSLGANIAIA